MKTKSLMWLLAGVLVLGFSSCSKDDDNKDVVDDTIVGGGSNDKKYGCSEESLQGSNYYLISLDDNTKARIPSANIVKDYRVNGQSIQFQVWPDTGDSYIGGTASGPNSYSEVMDWPSLIVGNIGWSGAGINVGGTDKIDLTAVTGEYVLHFAMKSQQAGRPHLLRLTDGSNTAGVCIGSRSFDDNGKTYPAYQDFERDGEWYEIEVPMSYFFNQGLQYREIFEGNIIEMISGATPGTTLDIDGIFIYKK